jgi:ABC-type transport system substrate-binding protein
LKSYWSKTLERRITRRRALVAAGATTAAAAFLAACGGGDDDDDGGGGDTSGLVYQVKDETGDAQHGGTYITTQNNAYARAPDVHRIGAHGQLAGRAYSQLFRIKHGKLKYTDGEFMGDLAQEWELSADQMTLTIKLEPEAGFAPISPVDGRIVDAEDVVFSFRRLIDEGSPLRGDIANEISSDAPIVSIEAVDASTVRINLAKPDATIYTILGLSGLGSLWIVPKESADFDVANNPLGSGPYMVTELLPEARVVYEKNPNFKRSTLKDNEPYIERIETPMILEAAARSAQFRAGNIHHTTFPRLELVGAKRENMDLLMYSVDPPNTERVYFGQNSDSPWIDKRLRQAFHALIDREAYVQAAYDVDFFEREGLSVDTFWEGSFQQNTWAGWTLDPSSEDDYGEAQVNFRYDPARAKKLVEAAGNATPWDFVWVRSTPGPTSFSRPIYDRIEIIEGMIRDSGVMNFEYKDLEWSTEWAPQVRQSKGAFTGTSWGPDTSSQDPALASFFVYHPNGGYFEGGDQHLADLALQIRAEFDVDRRRELVHELQRYDAEEMYNQKLGVATSFELIWPIVRNVGVYRGGTNWLDLLSPYGSELKAWIDPTKPPINEDA